MGYRYNKPSGNPKFIKMKGMPGAFLGAKQTPHQLFQAMGKFPEDLKENIGEEVTVEAYGSEPFQATLKRGPFSYVVKNSQTNLQLYVGEPVTITTKDGKTIDFSKIQI